MAVHAFDCRNAGGRFAHQCLCGAASGIPANMLDNVYLDALAYTATMFRPKRTMARSL